jgi:hypothetical protein
MLKAALPTGERIQFMVVSPTNVQFWGIPNKEWKSLAWQRLSHSYLNHIVSVVPEAAIKPYASGLEIKIDGKYLPTSAFQGKADLLADAIRQVKRDAESFYISDEAA